MENVKFLKDLKENEVPEKFKSEYYFDFKTHPFEHSSLFKTTRSVVEAVYEIGNYTKKLLKDTIDTKISKASASKISINDISTTGNFEVYVEQEAIFKPASIVGVTKSDAKPNRIYIEKKAKLLGATIFLDEGDIYIGEETIIEAGVGIKGPTIIGKKNDIRQGAYFRGSIITGQGCIFRGELKNVVMMDKANFPHPSYVGDSICGYQSHFGNQATTANLGIFEGIRDVNKRKNIVLRINGNAYDIGKPKLGIILGDFSQVGCNSVSDPGAFLAPYTIVYSLTRIQKGFYGPNAILKNKVFEKGIIEISPLK